MAANVEITLLGKDMVSVPYCQHLGWQLPGGMCCAHWSKIERTAAKALSLSALGAILEDWSLYQRSQNVQT